MLPAAAHPLKHTAAGIIQLQSLPLEIQIERSKRLIHEAMIHFNGKMAVSFSGGKDSTVLLHLVRSLYPDVPAVFVNTGLEYPEIVKHVRTTENVVYLRPKMRFKDVIEKYGYPVVSKKCALAISEIRNSKSEYIRNLRLFGNDKGTFGKLPDMWMYLVHAPFRISDSCCSVMKKNPLYKYSKQSQNSFFIGIMASDSDQRGKQISMHGCNAFDIKHPSSRPLAMWTEAHVWEYLRTFNIPYSPIYDMGYTRTGCMFCMFGLHMESYPNRFERMMETHPKLYRYCMEELGLKEVLQWYPKRHWMPQTRMFA